MQQKELWYEAVGLTCQGLLVVSCKDEVYRAYPLTGQLYHQFANVMQRTMLLQQMVGKGKLPHPELWFDIASLRGSGWVI
jgi:hypothetical protein